MAAASAGGAAPGRPAAPAGCRPAGGPPVPPAVPRRCRRPPAPPSRPPAGRRPPAVRRRAASPPQRPRPPPADRVRARAAGAQPGHRRGRRTGRRRPPTTAASVGCSPHGEPDAGPPARRAPPSSPQPRRRAPPAVRRPRRRTGAGTSGEPRRRAAVAAATAPQAARWRPGRCSLAVARRRPRRWCAGVAGACVAAGRDAAPGTAATSTRRAADAGPTGRSARAEGRRASPSRSQAVDVDGTCVGHAYGAGRRLPRRPRTAPVCPGRSTPPRSTGGAIVVSVSRVRMPDTAAAPGAPGAGRQQRHRQRQRPAARGRAVPRRPDPAGRTRSTTARSPARRVTIVETRVGGPGGRRQRRPARRRRDRGPGARTPPFAGARALGAVGSGRSRRPRPCRRAARPSPARPSRPALCGVELIRPKTACARARQAAASARRVQPGEHRHPHLDVAALQPAHLRRPRRRAASRGRGPAR